MSRRPHEPQDGPQTALAKRLMRRFLSPSLHNQVVQLTTRGPAWFLRWHMMLADAWIRDRANRRRYVSVTERDLRAARKSDTVFVFGSGYSLNDITVEEWRRFGEHDVLGLSLFVYEDWIQVGFHVVRGGIYGERRWRPQAEEVARAIRENPNFTDTIFLAQEGYQAQFTNQLAGYRLLREGCRLFRYKLARGDGPPTHSFAEGVRHVVGTLDQAVNVAYLLGWREIVLVGVDLYDSRYFWLGPEETQAIDPATARAVPASVNNVRGIRFDEPHNTAQNGVVQLFGSWAATLAGEGVELKVYNPRSLLCDVLPVYRFEHADGAVHA